MKDSFQQEREIRRNKEALSDSFLFCRTEGGYVKITLADRVINGRIKHLTELYPGCRMIVLEDKDINGVTIDPAHFKVSEIRRIEPVDEKAVPGEYCIDYRATEISVREEHSYKPDEVPVKIKEYHNFEEMEKYTDPKPFSLSGNGPITGNVDKLPSSEFMLLQQVRIQLADVKSDIEILKIKEGEAINALSKSMKDMRESMQRIGAYLEAEERKRNMHWWKKIFIWD